MFHYNQFNIAEEKRIYLARPGRHKIGQLQGIETARLYVYLQDIWHVDITIDKYIDGNINKMYDKIQPLMEVFIEDIGWFRIDSPASEQQINGIVQLTFSANGIETQLNDIDLILFYINTGESPSYEIFDENLDALGIPIRNIQFYIKNESQDIKSDKYWGLGLLNILEHNYLRSKGWKIGHIDNEIAVKRGRRFEIDTATCYNALTNDVSVAYECIFTFDRINRLINAYAIKDIGKSLNIECSFRNLINSANISPQENNVYTRFNCAGANDETSIVYVNFGSNYLFNLNYVITNNIFPQDFVDRYTAWIEYRESRRKEFADTFKEYLSYLNQIKLITNQLPTGAISYAWNTYSLEDLKVELSKFQAMLDRLVELNTVEGVLKIEESNDYALYLSIKNVIIPDIQNEIVRQEAGSVVKPDKIDYQFMWELYGINGLKERLAVCENIVKTLADAGYDKPYNPDNTSLTEDAYKKQHEEYLKNVKYVKEIKERLDKLTARVDDIQKKADAINDKRQEIIDSVDVRDSRFNFTTKEIETINILYIDTDFTDSTIEVVDSADIDDVIQLSWDLYDAAKEELEIRCKPQYKIDVSLDNLYHIPQFHNKADKIEVGDFMYLELDGGKKSRQRIIGYDIELVNFSNIDLNFTFSDAVNAYGKISDYKFLLGNANSVSKNSISKETKKYIDATIDSAAGNIFKDYFGGGGGGSINVFPNGISPDDLLKLQDALSGLISGSLSLDELKVKLAQIDTLEANSAFVKYLDAKFLVANQGDFKDLSAEVANIGSLLAGHAGVGELQAIHLTAQNAVIDELVVKNQIAKKLSVADLMAHVMSSEIIKLISSETGEPTIAFVGSTQQFYDNDGNVRVQIGQDVNGQFNFVIRGEDGKTTMFDENGITENGIPNDTIVGDMLQNSSIDKGKLNFDIIEPNEFGGIDISQVYQNGEKFGSVWNSFSEKVDKDLGEMTSSIENVTSIVDNVKKEIVNKIGKTDTFTVIDKDGKEISKSVSELFSQTTQDIYGLNSKTSEMSTTFNEYTSTVENKFSDFQQNLEGFKLEVSENYISNTDLDNLDLGATNLLVGTQWWDNLIETGTKKPINDKDFAYIHCTKRDLYVLKNFDVSNFERISISFDARTIFLSPTSIFDSNGNGLYYKLNEGYFPLSAKQDLNSRAASATAKWSVQLRQDSIVKDTKIFTINMSLERIWERFNTSIVIPEGVNNIVIIFSGEYNTTAYVDYRKLKIIDGVGDNHWTPSSDDLENRFSRNEAQITINKDSIENKVWSEDIKRQIATIEIGAVNLILDSGNYENDSNILWSGITKSDWKINIQNNILKITKLTASSTAWLLIPLAQTLEANKPYTFTAYLSTNKSKTIPIYAAISENQSIISNESIGSIKSLTTFSHVKLTHTMKYGNYGFLAIKGDIFGINDYIQIQNIMLEQGSIASDWRENGADIQLKVDTRIEKVNETIQNLNGTLSSVSQKVDTAVQFDEMDKYLEGLVDNEALKQELEDLKNNFNSSFVTQTQLNQTASSLTTGIQMAGGYNLIKNSIGLGTTKENTMTNWKYINPTNIKVYSVQGGSFAIYGGESEIVVSSTTSIGGGIYQDVTTSAGLTYTIAMHVNPNTVSDVKLKVTDVTSNKVISENLFSKTTLKADNYNYFYTQIKAQGNMTRISFEVINTTTLHIAGLRLVIGNNPLQWTLSSGESYSANVRMDVEGITVYHRDDASSFTRMSPDEFAIYSINERVAWAAEDEFHMKKAAIEDSIILGKILMKTVSDTSISKNRRGVLFISQST